MSYRNRPTGTDLLMNIIWILDSQILKPNMLPAQSIESTRGTTNST